MNTESKAGTFKLDSLQQVEQAEDEGVWVDVLHLNGQPLFLGGQKETPLRIKVAGTYSKAYREQVRRQRDEAIRRVGRFDGDDMDRRELAAAAACTLEWEGALDDDGTAIPLTKENAQMLYRAARFIYDQVDRAIGDHERFFGRS